MQSSLLSYLLLALTFRASHAAAAEDPEFLKDCLYKSMNPPKKAEPVIDYCNLYHPNTIPEFLTSEKLPYPRVVEYYSPTCPHCQQFAPQYVQFAKHFLNLTRSMESHYASLKFIEFHGVSCLAHKRVCHVELIKNYPTIKIIPAHKSSKDAIIIKAHELHEFTIAKALGADAIPWPEDAKTTETTNAKVQGPGNSVVKGSRLRGSNLSLRKTRGQIPVQQRLELPKASISLAKTNDHLDSSSTITAPRTQKELFSDAYLSFFMTMKNSVFLEPGPLSKNKQVILKNFLELLQGALPSWRIHSLLDKLLQDFTRITFHEKVWSMTLDKFPPHTLEWSPACQLHGNGYTCGLWSLFHILTVAVAEYNHVNVVRGEELSTFLTGKVAETLKDFIATFFICEECTTHFVQEYEDCAFDRCNRLQDDRRTPHTSLAQWSQLPLWLLQMHNSVNVRLQGKRKNVNPLSVEEQQVVMWPSVDECPACWLETNGAESKYNDVVMYKYLRVTYWPEDDETKIMREEIIRSLKTNDSTHKAIAAKITGKSPPKQIAPKPVVVRTNLASARKQIAAKRISAKVTAASQPHQTTSTPIATPVTADIQPKQDAPKPVHHVPDVPPLEPDDASKDSQNSRRLLFPLLILAGVVLGSNKRHLLRRKKSWVYLE